MANPFTTCTIPPQELSYVVCTHLRDSCLFWWHVFYLFVPFWWGLPTFPSWLLHSHSTFSRDGSRRLLFPRVCDWRDYICFRQIVMLSFMLVKIINVGWYYCKNLLNIICIPLGMKLPLCMSLGLHECEIPWCMFATTLECSTSSLYRTPLLRNLIFKSINSIRDLSLALSKACMSSNRIWRGEGHIQRSRVHTTSSRSRDSRT